MTSKLDNGNISVSTVVLPKAVESADKGLGLRWTGPRKHPEAFRHTVGSTF
ncbi:MAG: hypothetical protein ACPGQT_06950 [Rhodothermales bacterium]